MMASTRAAAYLAPCTVSMPKVLVIAPYVPHPARHGGAIRSRVLLDALRCDHEVHLAAAVASHEDRSNADALAADAEITVHPLAAHAAPKANLLRKLGKWAAGNSELVSRRWRLAEARRQVRQLVDEHDFDLVVADSTFALPVCAERSQLLYLHNLEHAMFARDEGQERRWSDRFTRSTEAKYLREYEMAAIERHALTVTVSDHDQQLAFGMAPNARVEVVPNSIDLERLAKLPIAHPDAALRLLFVGSLDYPPNLEAVTELVEVHMRALREAFPELTVRLVGKDPRGSGKQFESVPGVELIGPVDDVVEHYRNTHAVYLPIRSGGGTRIKILEAWALGVPVLSTAVGSEGLPGVDGVHLQRFETAEQGVQVVRALHNGDAPRLAENGRLLVEEHFSHAAAVARLRELVDELLVAQ